MSNLETLLFVLSGILLIWALIATRRCYQWEEEATRERVMREVIRDTFLEYRKMMSPDDEFSEEEELNHIKARQKIFDTMKEEVKKLSQSQGEE